MKKLLALFLTLFVITTNAYAEWINYSSYNFFFYDNSSIKRNGNKVRVWNYNNVKSDDMKAKSMNIGSMRALDEIDCINETYTTLALDSYSKPNLEGDFETIKVSSKIDYIVPSSTHSSLMKLVCKK
jgi:hypothetical protein